MQEENGNRNYNVLSRATNCNSSCCNCLFTIFHPCLTCRNGIIILLLGLDNSGKSTLISTIMKEVKNDKIPTWGFDEKIWNTRTFWVSLYDLGGGKSIRGIWPHYYAEAYGVIFVVDGADGNRIWEASEELKKALKHPRLVGKPFLIVANKLNVNTALQYEELMSVLGPFNTNEQAFIYSDCRLQNRGTIDKGLQLGLDWLLASIKFHYNELQERVAFESAKQKDEEQRSLMERQLRSKSYKEEKEAARHLQPIDLKDLKDLKDIKDLKDLKNLKDLESEAHARMHTWISPDGSNPEICTYEHRVGHEKSFKLTMADFDKFLQPMVQHYEESSHEPTYSPKEIVEYFGSFVHKSENFDEVPPQLPGQPNLTTN